MIDVHCHLNFHSFKDDYDEVIKNAQEAGVKTIINTGTKLDSSQWAVDLAQKYDNLYAIVGIHPHHADKMTRGHTDPPIGGEGSPEEWIEQLEQIARQPKVVGIGECGLDYFSYKSNGIVDPKLQKEVFIRQIELAHRLKLPIQIHNRHAGEDVITILKEHKRLLQPIPGMFHCFAGTKEVLKDALDLGFYIGFDGNSTYKGMAPGETISLSELAKLTPLERIVTETDSPFLTPEPHRGSRNEPKYVILIGEFLAQIKDLSFEEFQAQTEKNAQTLFNLEVSSFS